MDQTLVAPASEAPSEAETAFEALYRSSRDDVYAYVAGLLRDRSAAEDVTAQAFERAYRRRASFNPRRGTHRAWLFGIARNAALDELRRRRRQTELADDPEDEGAAEALDDAAEAALRRSVVRHAIAGLDPRERELIALKYFAGLSNAEIAAVLQTSQSNAGTRLHRAIEKLRQACDQEGRRDEA
ncbi:MAG: sigma-70 family RNA polymerase sigma factor [Solirubrobacterales bacterium]|nr:sigma-70 family RNA polymerase sigma factor [Solirubrobacterales bacterium]